VSAPELSWIRTRCESGNCVEVAAVGTGTVAIRSSDLPLDKLRVTRMEWDAFLAGAKAGDFDTV
jgi:hypothetical protein